MWSSVEEITVDPIHHHHGNLEKITDDTHRHHGDLEKITEDPGRHHDKIPTRASPGKAANGHDGCSHHDKIPTRQQMAKMVAVITTEFPLSLALARQ
jgi:hypothetical protein